MHNSVCHVYDVFLLSNLSQSSMGCQASIVAILLSERSKLCVVNLCSDAYSATLLCFAGAQLPGRAHSNVEGQQMVASWMDAWWLPGWMHGGLQHATRLLSCFSIVLECRYLKNFLLPAFEPFLTL